MFLAFFRDFLLCRPSLSSAHSQGGNPPEDWQSAVGWGDAGFEPGTVGQQSDVLLLSQATLRKNSLVFEKAWIWFRIQNLPGSGSML